MLRVPFKQPSRRYTRYRYKQAQTDQTIFTSQLQKLIETIFRSISHIFFPHDRYQTTTIVNTDDAIPGSGMFVRSSLESNKKLYPWSQFIVDSNGVTRKAWQLEEESSAIVVLDKNGRVEWVKDGALTQDEVQQVVALLHKLLTQ